MSKQLTEEQEKIRDYQIEKNKEYITRINDLIIRLKPFLDETITYKEILDENYNILNKCHGNLLQGKYADYYTKDLKPASSSIFTFYQEINNNFEYLSQNKRNKFEERLPDLKEYEKRVEKYSNMIRELIDDIYSDNSFILRFEGMGALYSELNGLSNTLWDSKEIIKDQLLGNRQFVTNSHMTGISIVYPYHIDLFMKYGRLFMNVVGLNLKLTGSKKILKSVNSNLPFAELCDKTPIIQNNVLE